MSAFCVLVFIADPCPLVKIANPQTTSGLGHTKNSPKNRRPQFALQSWGLREVPAASHSKMQPFWKGFVTEIENHDIPEFHVALQLCRSEIK